jgi:hypothetical protein
LGAERNHATIADRNRIYDQGLLRHLERPQRRAAPDREQIRRGSIRRQDERPARRNREIPDVALEIETPDGITIVKTKAVPSVVYAESIGCGSSDSTSAIDLPEPS